MFSCVKRSSTLCSTQLGRFSSRLGVLNFSRPLLFFTEEWLCNIRLSHTRLSSNQAAETLPCSRYQATGPARVHQHTEASILPSPSPSSHLLCCGRHGSSWKPHQSYPAGIFHFLLYILPSPPSFIPGFLQFSGTSHLPLAGCSPPDKHYVFITVYIFPLIIHSGPSITNGFWVCILFVVDLLKLHKWHPAYTGINKWGFYVHQKTLTQEWSVHKWWARVTSVSYPACRNQNLAKKEEEGISWGDLS